jgi:cation:H+ antiporter
MPLQERGDLRARAAFDQQAAAFRPAEGRHPEREQIGARRHRFGHQRQTAPQAHAVADGPQRRHAECFGDLGRAHVVADRPAARTSRASETAMSHRHPSDQSRSALFSAAVLAAATSLPEISTGLQSVPQAQGDDQLAVGDIFVGQRLPPHAAPARHPGLGQSRATQAHATGIYLTGLGLLLLGMGIDSLAVLVLYLISLGSLFAIAAVQPAA